MTAIRFEKSIRASGEAARGFCRRLERGFWSDYVPEGAIVDIGYKGGDSLAQPLFKGALGLDLDTPGYNGSDFPFESSTISCVHASHFLEHVSDYAKFFREAFRVLRPHGTLIITVPMMEAYERKTTPPSRFNGDHKRFYTSSRLLSEVEKSLPRDNYRILHLRELFNVTDLTLPPDRHANGPFYEIELVVQKTIKDAVYG